MTQLTKLIESGILVSSEVRMNKRLSDQVLVLEAIETVRAELKAAVDAAGFNLETHAVMGRLMSLYALLDVKRLGRVAKAADQRKSFERKKTA